MSPPPGVRLSRYRDALREHLRRGASADISTAVGMGTGMSMPRLIAAHEATLSEVLAALRSTAERRDVKRQAKLFLVAALLPRRHSVAAAADAQHVAEAIAKRDPLSIKLIASERALDRCRERQRELQAESDSQHQSQREVYRRILLAQEHERKELSRELHDVIAQSLSSINIQLAGLKLMAERNAKNLDTSIAATQKLVAESVEFVQRFARDLRPAMLDDLGLIPALQELMGDITVRTGLRIHLAVCASVEELGMTRRTVLYRVAQEALTNITRHAKASQVEVRIRRIDGWFRMTIHDDGTAFSVRRALRNGGKRLGLLCMRERLEMVGGTFDLESATGRGTTVSAGVPAVQDTRRLTKPSRLPGRRAKP